MDINNNYLNEFKRPSKNHNYKDIFHISNWINASFNERLNALQKLENEYAKKYGRLPCTVIFESVDSIHYCGHYNSKDNKIYLNEGLLKGYSRIEKMPDEIPLYLSVITIIHEGRHAYQRYAMEYPDIHNKKEDIQKWKENTVVYYSESASYKYRFQPLERDAHDYAENEIDKLYSNLGKKHGINKGYEWFRKNIVRKSVEKYAEVAKPMLGDNYVKIMGEMTDEIMHREYKKIIDKVHNNSTAVSVNDTKNVSVDRLREIRKAPDIKNLRSNSPSKTLYDAYAKEVLGRTGEWKKDSTNQEIAMQMLKDGRSMRRIQDAMRHSPDVAGLTGAERTVKTRELLCDISKTQETKDLVKSNEIGR